jgi:hypothetical protein
MIDLTPEEQVHVRAALRFLRSRSGSWAMLAKTMGFKRRTLQDVRGGRPVTPTMAFRAARVAGASMDDLLAGRFPPAGTCPTCGYCAQGAPLQD